MSAYPLSFVVVAPADGGEPHLRIRAAGNGKILVSSQTYASGKEGVANAIAAIIHAVQDGRFVVKYETDGDEVQAVVT